MYRTKNTPVQITVPNYREPLSGVVATAMAIGALVMYKNDGAPQDERILIACEGNRPAILEQQVLTDANWQAHNKLDPQWSLELRKPVPVGSAVTARFAHEAEFEGTDYFDTLDGNSTPGTPLYVTGGKFKTATLATHVVVARLGRKLTPFLSTSFRWSVEFIG